MSNPTTPFSWQMPTNTDLVTNLPADFEVFGQAVATSMADLLGGTTGQILSKNSNTDMDFVWIANDQGDITGITATSPLTGGGTSGAITVGIQSSSTTQAGAVQLTDSTASTSTTTAATPNSVKTSYDLAAAAIAKSTVTTAGDIIYRNATVPTRLGIGTAGQVLTVNSGATAPEWATPSTGATFVGCKLYDSGAGQAISSATASTVTWNSERFDTDGFHSTSSNTGRITIPSGKAGKYSFTAFGSWSTGTTGLRSLSIYKNGADFSPVNVTASAQYPTTQVTTIDNAIVGDYYEVVVYQNNGTSQTFSSNGINGSFMCTYLGA
jgi:hypothetical protein